MSLDVQTLIVVLMASFYAIGLTLPVIMGRRVSRAARCFQASIVAQALGWTSFILAGLWLDRWLSALCMALLSASFVLSWHALRGWLGPRPGRTLLLVVAAATPVGYALLFGHYAARVGWANFGLALQMAIVCAAVAWPAPQASWRWRGVVLLCLAALASVTVWRGVLGAFFTADYPHYRAPHPVNLAAAVLNCVTLVLTTLGFLVAWREEVERELHRQASTDGLTALMNRRVFEQRAAELLQMSRRYHDPMALLLIDLDHFKQINDQHGHAGGDRALQAFAQVLRASVRSGDLVCRYGGEEFCVLMMRADVAAATAFDRRLRAALDRPAEGGQRFGFSSGLTLLRGTEAQLGEAVGRADEALYAAKAAGRGCMVTRL